MLKLIRENVVATTFRKIVDPKGKTLVAVAFWGAGSIKSLGLEKLKDCDVLCNLESLACNPYVISDIIALGHNVKSHPRLHAKMYIGAATAIVGSSNASTNGLVLEGALSAGWIEANIVSDDAAIMSQARGLFSEVWNSTEAYRPSGTQLKNFQKRWEDRPAPQIISAAGKTLLEACRTDTSLRARVFVVPWKDDLGDEAEEQLSSFKSSAKGFSLRSTCWGYQFDTPPEEGLWLIDLDLSRPGKPRVNGCSKTSGINLRCTEERDVAITVRAVVKNSLGRSLPLSPLEKSKLCKFANSIFESIGERDDRVPIAEVLKIIDAAPNPPQAKS